jgi:hypothetical protein
MAAAAGNAPPPPPPHADPRGSSKRRRSDESLRPANGVRKGSNSRSPTHRRQKRGSLGARGPHHRQQ